VHRSFTSITARDLADQRARCSSLHRTLSARALGLLLHLLLRGLLLLRFNLVLRRERRLCSPGYSLPVISSRHVPRCQDSSVETRLSDPGSPTRIRREKSAA
jgi:hypothetical protein